MNHHEIKSEPYVLFEVASTTYALRGADVLKLEMIEHITPVPNATSDLEGVVFSQGEVIPAVSLRTRFGFPKVDHDIRTRLIVVGAAGRSLGLIVDGAREFLRIPEEAIAPPPESVLGTTGKYLRGIATIGDRLILILDLEELIKISESNLALAAD